MINVIPFPLCCAANIVGLAHNFGATHRTAGTMETSSRDELKEMLKYNYAGMLVATLNDTQWKHYKKDLTELGFKIVSSCKSKHAGEVHLICRVTPESQIE